MPFATIDDARVHLPLDKLEITQADFNRIELDSERIIRGYMANVVPALTIAGWTDPSITDLTHVGYVPELIRAIAGRFIAAFYYKERYSEDSLEVPQYAQDKYNEAMSLITGIVGGTIIMDDLAAPIDVGERLTSDDFYPNHKDAGPMFTVDDHFFSVLGTGGR